MGGNSMGPGSTALQNRQQQLGPQTGGPMQSSSGGMTGMQQLSNMFGNNSAIGSGGGMGVTMPNITQPVRPQPATPFPTYSEPVEPTNPMGPATKNNFDTKNNMADRFLVLMGAGGGDMAGKSQGYLDAQRKNLMQWGSPKGPQRR